MMYHYVYRITNTQQHKHYYGVRSTKHEPHKDIGIRYFSSSRDKVFIKDQKLNPNIYKYKIIKLFETRKEALLLEIKLHDKFNVSINESFYNRAKQKVSGFDTTGATHDRNKGTSNPMYGKQRCEHSYNMSGTKNHFYGKSHTKETKELLSETNRGFVVAKKISTGEVLRVSKEEFDKNQDLVGHTKGQPVSEEGRKKRSVSQKGRKKKKQKRLKCPHCEKITAQNQATRWHFDNCKVRNKN